MNPVTPIVIRLLLALSIIHFTNLTVQSQPQRQPSLNEPLITQAQPANDSQPELRDIRDASEPDESDAADQEVQSGSQEEPEPRLYSFRADGVDLKTALAMFARANNLNIVPDHDVTGQVTLDIHDLPLDKVMEALLDAYDYSWYEDGGLIRIRAYETETYVVDYLRLVRKGIGMSSATLTSGTGGGGSGGGAGGGGGGLGGGGGGLGGGGGAGGGGSGGGGGGAGGSVGGSSINLTQENPIEFWDELEEELLHMLSPKGKETLAINKTAGLIQVTDRPSHLETVGNYLNKLTGTIQRQVDIEAKLYDVTLNDQFHLGIDWEHMIKTHDGLLTLTGSPTVLTPLGAEAVKAPSITTMFANDNTSVVLTALKEQGEVEVISQPRLRTLNNQTALIKVGTETPFFTKTTTFIPGVIGTGSTAIEEDNFHTITVGTILYITPQISTNRYITLDISPVITSLVETKVSPSETTTAPVLDIKQASTIVRVNDGDTIVIGGLIQTTESETKRKVPLLGDIPLLGRLFTGTFKSNSKKELVIFLTPTIVQ